MAKRNIPKVDWGVANNDQFRQLIKSNQKAQAIELYRQLSGVDLVESEKAVEYLLRVKAEDTARYNAIDWSVGCSEEMQNLLNKGWRIDAIGLYMERTGVNLRTAVNNVVDIENEREQRCNEQGQTSSDTGGDLSQ